MEYIATLNFDEAELNMKKYGNVLIENVPNEATQFLKALCTSYLPANKILSDKVNLDASCTAYFWDFSQSKTLFLCLIAGATC